MLIKIELENFYSIRDRICIDFRAGNIHSSQAKKLADNVIEWKGIKILKTLGLFGANASGKSSILKSLDFCRKLILESHQYNENTVFDYAPFKFEGGGGRPSVFLVDFVHDDIEYEYSFSLLGSEIVAESLFHYPNDRKARVFERDGDEYRFAAGALFRPKDVAANTGSKNLFLSRASSMNRELPRNLYRFFLDALAFGSAVIGEPETEAYFDKRKELILSALRLCDSDICDIEKRREIVAIPALRGAGPASAFREAVKFKTFHRADPSVPFDLAEESEGTKKLFAILVGLIDAAKRGKSIALDEFDSSLHANIADFVLDFVHASSRAQLLFASHNLGLIDTTRLRRDQIVFVAKNEFGATEVSSLYDYKDFRENMNAEKAYRQGRFDAVPVVTSTVEGLKSMLEEEE